MNKRIHYIIMTAIAALSAVLVACGTNENATFNGSKTGDENHFDIDFEILNSAYEHELVMEEGESIEVSIHKESGEISVLIQQESHDPVYKGDDVQDGEFEVIISEAGTYTVSVTGKKAKGRVIFTRQKKSDSTDDISKAHISAEQIAGPWHLDSEKNDLTAFWDIFPAYSEFGASMEIKSNGQINWYIGTEGGTGTYTQDGDTLTADIVRDVDQQPVTVIVHLISDDEIVRLEMDYNGTNVYWAYGDSEEPSATGE